MKYDTNEHTDETETDSQTERTGLCLSRGGGWERIGRLGLADGNYYIWLPWWLRRYSVCLQCGRPGFDSWVGKIPWRRKWHSTPALLPGKSHGRRSLIGYSPWGCKESDTTEQLQFNSIHPSKTSLAQETSSQQSPFFTTWPVFWFFLFKPSLPFTTCMTWPCWSDLSLPIFSSRKWR